VAVLPIDWSIFRNRFPAGAEPPALANFFREEGTVSSNAPGRGRYLEELKRAPSSERRALLTAYLQERIAEVLRMDAAHLPPMDQGFADMGLDSLMALELKTRLEFDLGISLSATMVFNYPTIESFGENLFRNVLGLDENTTSSSFDPREKAQPKPIEEDLAELNEIRKSSDEELAALIAQEYDANQ
jgi:acyl carrier protein